MMYINQTMTSDVLAISAIIIVLLFLHRHRKISCRTATELWLHRLTMLHLRHTITYLFDAMLIAFENTFACAQAHNERCGLMSSITKDSSKCSFLPNDPSTAMCRPRMELLCFQYY